MTRRSKRAGFTLLELILAFSVLSVVLTLLIPLLFSTYEMATIQNSIALIEQNGSQLMLEMERDIRSSEAVVLPLPGNTATLLILQRRSRAEHPIIYGVKDGELLRITSNTNETITIPQIIVESLRVRNVSASESGQSVFITVRLSREISLPGHAPYTKDFSFAIDLPPEDNKGTGCDCDLPECPSPTNLQWHTCKPNADECHPSTKTEQIVCLLDI